VIVLKHILETAVEMLRDCEHHEMKYTKHSFRLHRVSVGKVHLYMN